MRVSHEVLRVDFITIQEKLSTDVEIAVWANVRNQTNETITFQLRTHVRRDIIENFS